jgi:hypothetical protein
MLGDGIACGGVEVAAGVSDGVGAGRGCSVATAAFSASSDREMRVQRIPCLAKSWAMARPMPREPPVMRAWRGRDTMLSFAGMTSASSDARFG